MDPDATWKIVTDESADLDERAVAATDLLCWLAAQGFPPLMARTHDGFPLRRIEIADECRYRIFKALDRLAELEP